MSYFFRYVLIIKGFTVCLLRRKTYDVMSLLGVVHNACMSSNAIIAVLTSFFVWQLPFCHSHCTLIVTIDNETLDSAHDFTTVSIPTVAS